MNHGYIDLTRTVAPNMPVYWTDEPVKIEKIRDLATDKYNDWRLTSGMHVGTHIDGPGHLTDSAVRLSDLAIERFIGRGYLIDARNKKMIDVSLLEKIPTYEGLIILILTGWDKKFGTKEYFDNHPVITQDFAEELVRRNVKMVGLDLFSPDRYPFEVHKILFRNEILLIENLVGLEQLVDQAEFTVVALPLKTETDSALARIIAIL